MNYNVTDTLQHNFKLLTVKIYKKYILTGGTNKSLLLYTLPNLDFNSVAVHNKSIRATAINYDLFGCASYDGTCTIFKDKKIFDIIEGPETEIKDLVFSRNNKYIALATRGKTVWVLNVKEDSLEIEAVLDYHTQDVKGVVFYNENLYSYGYDNTIKVFEKTNYGKQSWEMIQNIEEHENTVWDLVFCNNMMMSCDGNGYINFYRFEDEWKIHKKFKASLFEIYSMCIVKDKYLAYTMNLKNIMIIDFDCNAKCSIKDLHNGEINQIAYCKENAMLTTVGDDGKLNLVKLSMKKNLHE